MTEERPFNRYTHCSRCKRYIDEIEVKLKKIIVGAGDTYRHTDPEYLDKLHYERICSDCFYGGKK